MKWLWSKKFVNGPVFTTPSSKVAGGGRVCRVWNTRTNHGRAQERRVCVISIKANGMKRMHEVVKNMTNVMKQTHLWRMPDISQSHIHAIVFVCLDVSVHPLVFQPVHVFQALEHKPWHDVALCAVQTGLAWATWVKLTNGLSSLPLPQIVQQTALFWSEIHRGTFELLHKNTQIWPLNPTKITWTQKFKNKW
jgi:hypothetical protein